MSYAKPADQMDVGDELAPLEFRVTPEWNQQFLYAEEDYHSRYIEAQEDGPPLVHPALLLQMTNATRSPSYKTSPGLGSIHASEETAFLGIARVGTRLRVTWRVIDRFEKRGRVYHVHEALLEDADGRFILKRRQTFTYSRKTHPG